jgi:hypothetical protein
MSVHQPGGNDTRFWRQDYGYDKRRNADEKQFETETAVASNVDIQFFYESGVWSRLPGAIRMKVMIKSGGGGSTIGEDGSIIPGTEGELIVEEFPADQIPETARIQIGQAGRGGTQGDVKAPDGSPGYAVVITYLEGQEKDDTPQHVSPTPRQARRFLARRGSRQSASVDFAKGDSGNGAE